MQIAKTTKKQANKKPTVKRETYQLDAEGKILGRLATQIAILLQGKNKATFQPYLDNGNNVIITNAAKIKTTGRKIDQKVYYHYSGYPGGLKIRKMIDVFKKNPAEVLKRTVWNMLPKNKLRDKMIKRLKISN